MDELAHTRLAGSSEANVLGIEDFDNDYLFVFQCLLEGQTTEQIREVFEREVPRDELQSLGNKPEELCGAIRLSPIFKSIFMETPSAIAAEGSCEPIPRARISLSS